MRLKVARIRLQYLPGSLLARFIARQNSTRFDQINFAFAVPASNFKFRISELSN